MTIIEKLAMRCKASVGHLKGKAREQATIAFWNGAMAIPNPDSKWITQVGWLLIATRGYSEIEHICSQIKE